MRVIEREMIEAIQKGIDWRKDNTQIVQCLQFDFADVLLHGHSLGCYNYTDQKFYPNPDTLRQWPTNTTKSRLRALDVDVYTRNHITYLNGEPV
jgi:hypothetical protein